MSYKSNREVQAYTSEKLANKRRINLDFILIGIVTMAILIGTSIQNRQQNENTTSIAGTWVSIANPNLSVTFSAGGSMKADGDLEDYEILQPERITYSLEKQDGLICWGIITSKRKARQLILTDDFLGIEVDDFEQTKRALKKQKIDASTLTGNIPDTRYLLFQRKDSNMNPLGQTLKTSEFMEKILTQNDKNLTGVWKAKTVKTIIDKGEDPLKDIDIFLDFRPNGTLNTWTIEPNGNGEKMEGNYFIDNNDFFLFSEGYMIQFPFSLNDEEKTLTLQPTSLITELSLVRADSLPTSTPLPSETSLTQLIYLPPSMGAKADRASCQSNLKQITLSIYMYLQDYEGVFTTSLISNLEDTLSPYIMSKKIFQCPVFQGSGDSYSTNTNLNDHTLNEISNPAKTVLVYEGSDGKLDYRHLGGANVGFADGHVKWITPEEAADLWWHVDGP